MSDRPAAHSADWFGPSRGLWWNRDYLELIARRLGWRSPLRVLDAGCGQGHWGRELAYVLPPSSSVFGIDREAISVSAARNAASALAGLPVRFSYQVADILHVPFAADLFDVVTCQTVLIHLDSPINGLREMLRVLRPGGWIVCAEPNNLVGSVTFDSTAWNNELSSVLDGVELAWRCEMGKMRLGEGFNSAGELVPGWFASLGVETLHVFISDKAVAAWPPYDDDMLIGVADARRSLENGRLVYDRDTTRRYWLAGGGDDARFEAVWRKSLADLTESVRDMEQQSWSTAGGSLMYLVTGTKRRLP